jgi:hypothetical protein
VVPYEPIPLPPEPNAGQRPEGCRHIYGDVDQDRWRFCQRPVHHGVWCLPHYAASRIWPRVEYRQRLGEELIRMLTQEGPDEAA